MWRKEIDRLYKENNLIQGNKTTYKSSVIRYGNVLLDEDFIDKYINELQNTSVSSAKTHTQMGIMMFKDISVVQFKESFFIVKNDFISMHYKINCI